MPLSVHLMIIDPQNDFMGNDDGTPYSVQSFQATLPVQGAVSDMRRLAQVVDRIGTRLENIHVTLDSHHVIDVAHPGMWRNHNGDSPAPFTIITPADLDNDVWFPKLPSERARLRKYVQSLADQGNYPLCIWPEHCLIGTWGHNVQEDLDAALQRWCRNRTGNIHYVIKGDDVFTEHYGALQAEVTNPASPGTLLNSDFLKMLEKADIIGVAGEASSHCVKETVNQIATNIGIEHVKKFHVITDCMSPVIHPTIDFPAITKAFFADMAAKGMTLTTSDKFLA